MTQRARVSPRASVLALSMLVSLTAGACGGKSDGGTREVALVDLPCASLDGATGIWESASFPASASCGNGDAGVTCCAWVEFPGHTTVRLEHGLPTVPRVVDAWIAFSEYGVGATTGSGDSARLQAVDDTFVTLENDTDQRFYLRVDLR